MSFAVVTVETETGEKLELALPLEVPSRVLVEKILRDLGKTIRTAEAYSLCIVTGHGDKPISPTVSLRALGVVDGQHLRIKRETAVKPARATGPYAYLRTENGTLLPLESSNVIIGRKDTLQQVPLDLDLTDYDPDHAVSRRHASIGREGSTYYLIDLRSTNGTQLNGHNVVPGKKMALKDGDRIDFGLGMRVTFVAAALP
ncbi:MAG TPA: FHA domain-containing protein [Anaerolineales bacterium]